MELQPDDLQGVLHINSPDGGTFFLIIRHDVASPRIDLNVPLLQSSVEEPLSIVEDVATLYQDASYASESVADSYSRSLRTGETCVEVVLTKQRIQDRA